MPVKKFKIKPVSKEMETLYYSHRPKANNKTSRAVAYIYTSHEMETRKSTGKCNYQTCKMS